MLSMWSVHLQLEDRNRPKEATEVVCDTLQSQMAVVETAEEDVYVRGWLTQISGSVGVDCIWIGLTDANIEGRWTIFKTNQLAQYTGWSPGEPNGGINANCAVLWKRVGYMWADENCHSHRAVLCETPFQEATIPVG
ncbi:hypothetical protein ScPMuIL_005327 [Solemya velum]